MLTKNATLMLDEVIHIDPMLIIDVKAKEIINNRGIDYMISFAPLERGGVLVQEYSIILNKSRKFEYTEIDLCLEFPDVMKHNLIYTPL